MFWMKGGNPPSHLFHPSNVTSISFVNFNTAPCAIGWTILRDLCQILIPFLILINTHSPWLFVWISNFYVDVCKTVPVKATVSRLFVYFRLITFACLFSSV